jgi:hypothetical protein
MFVTKALASVDRGTQSNARNKDAVGNFYKTRVKMVRQMNANPEKTSHSDLS